MSSISNTEPASTRLKKIVLVGHLRRVNIPFVHYISTSTFHAEHHQDADHNFGFYTLIWDRLFVTLSPDYVRDFTLARSYDAEVP